MWVIFGLGLNVGVAGMMAGERAFGGVERVQGGCGGGGEKRTCIPGVEPTLAVRGGGMVMAERILLDLTCYELLVLVRFGRGGEETPESGSVVGHEWWGRLVLSMLLKYLLSGTCTRTNVGCICGDEGSDAALRRREFGAG